jgi:hypothetical protein
MILDQMNLRNGDRERQSGGRSTRKARGENVAGWRQEIALELDPPAQSAGRLDGQSSSSIRPGPGRVHLSLLTAGGIDGR